MTFRPLDRSEIALRLLPRWPCRVDDSSDIRTRTRDGDTPRRRRLHVRRRVVIRRPGRGGRRDAGMGRDGRAVRVDASPAERPAQTRRRREQGVREPMKAEVNGLIAGVALAMALVLLVVTRSMWALIPVVCCALWFVAAVA